MGYIHKAFILIMEGIKEQNLTGKKNKLSFPMLTFLILEGDFCEILSIAEKSRAKRVFFFPSPLFI